MSHKDILKLALNNPKKYSRLIGFSSSATPDNVEEICIGLTDNYIVLDTKNAVLNKDSLKNRKANSLTVEDISLDSKVISLDFYNCHIGKQRKFLISLLKRVKNRGVTIVAWNYGPTDRELPYGLVDVYEVIEDTEGYIDSKFMQSSISGGRFPTRYKNGYVWQVEHSNLDDLVTDEIMADKPFTYISLGKEYVGNILNYLFLEKTIRVIPRDDNINIGQLLLDDKLTFLICIDDNVCFERIISVIEELKASHGHDFFRVIILDSSKNINNKILHGDYKFFADGGGVVWGCLTDPNSKYFAFVENRRKFLKPTDGSDYYTPYVNLEPIVFDFKSYVTTINRFSKGYKFTIIFIELSDVVYEHNQLDEAGISELNTLTNGVYFQTDEENSFNVENVFSKFAEFTNHRRYSENLKGFNFIVFHKSNHEFDFDEFVTKVNNCDYLLNEINRYKAINPKIDTDTELTYFNLR